MKLAVFGATRIGVTAAATFAANGYDVICADDDKTIISALKNGSVPFNESGLQERYNEALRTGMLAFSTNKLAAAAEASYLLFTESLQTNEDQVPDLTNLYRFIRQIAVSVQSHKTFIIKSTVPPGTTTRIHNILIEQGLTEQDFEVIHNPDFSRPGTIVKDFTHPSELIIGTSSLRGCRLMESFYSPLTNALQFMDYASAELMKYACHTYLALNSSCLNMIAGMAERYGADVEVIHGALRADPRMGHHSRHPGSFYQGNESISNVSTFREMENQSFSGSKLINLIEEIERYQPEILTQKLKDFLGTLHGSIIGVLGDSYTKEAPSPSDLVSKRLEEEGAEVRFFDPSMEHHHSSQYRSLMNDTVSNCDALLLLTELPLIQNVDWGQVVKRQRLPLLVDGHNLFTLEEARKIANEHDLIYCSIGRPNIYKGLGAISVQQSI
ncbi:nucleotide sugar dehydrogenase [Alkalihalobacillus sp. CinArs1]|uniref:nucleotide sugar dehydrogenase n=1 Tax=Alkalihalobacillus sp. CinArs1 TaxID=2995314 RepID=UPI0022DE94C6|nr:nucleotide sugar dehydrogenase [Alkalihalobacillus sp. CinArs1]